MENTLGSASEEPGFIIFMNMIVVIASFVNYFDSFMTMRVMHYDFL